MGNWNITKPNPLEKADDNMAMANQQNIDLAAALFYVMGFYLPHKTELEDEAQKLVSSIPNKEKRLLKIIALCGEPETPKQYYIVAKAYSWLGLNYEKEIIKYCTFYLNTEGWKDLSHNTVFENGIMVNQSTRIRASLLIDLAQAQNGAGHCEAALSNYMEAYRLEPYNAMTVVKAADVIAKFRTKEEAVNFLNQQKASGYYTPLKYKDSAGNHCKNDTFQQLLNAHIHKLQENNSSPAW